MVTRSSPKIIKFPSTVKAHIKADTAKKAQTKPKDYYIRDTLLNGYHIRVRASGKKTYGIESKMPRTKEKISITIGDINLYAEKDARKRAIELLLKIKDNIDPRDERLVLQGANKNLLEVLEEYLVSRDQPLAQKTSDGYRYNLKTFIPKIAAKPIASIKKEELMDWYQGAKSKPRAAATTFGTVKTLLKFAEAMGYIDINPAEKAKIIIGKFKRKQSIKALIPFNELHKFLGAYGECTADSKISNTMRDFILLILVTGIRRSEAESLRWEQVNFEKKTISLPDNKANRYFEIPMTRLTYDLFKWRLENTKKSDYVFPGTGKKGHIVEPKRAFKKIAEKAELSHNLNSHALRRTFATICKELDISLDDSGKLLNHANRNVTDSYVIRSLEHQRNLYDKVLRKIESQIPYLSNGEVKYGMGNGFRVFFYGADSDEWLNINLDSDDTKNYWDEKL
jgi:integrase